MPQRPAESSAVRGVQCRDSITSTVRGRFTPAECGAFSSYQDATVKGMVEGKVIRDTIDAVRSRRPCLRWEVNMNVHLSLGHGHHDHRHTTSDVMLAVVLAGLAFTAFSIAMMYEGASQEPWHMLAVLIGIPSALTASFFCLVRGWENSQ